MDGLNGIIFHATSKSSPHWELMHATNASMTLLMTDAMNTPMQLG